jgi:hypothetical protein
MIHQYNQESWATINPFHDDLKFNLGSLTYNKQFHMVLLSCNKHYTATSVNVF